MGKSKVVILGAGYAGLQTTVRLQKKLSADEAELVLVNKNDYHYETTWLHEASSGTLKPEKVSYDIRDVIDSNRVKFVKDSVEKIDAENKKVKLSNSELAYDYLVVALGGESESFGTEGIDEYALTISSLDNAVKINEHIESQFQAYQKDKNEDHLSIVVGGAGFTGIEFLGELVDRVPDLCETYGVDQKKVKIYCVEMAPTALPGFAASLVDFAKASLEKKGVEFRLGTALKKCTPEGVMVAKGEEEPYLIKANTVIWAAGVRGNSVIVNSGFENKRARVSVDKFMRLPQHEDVFIIGDCSSVINKETNRPYPPTAQIGMQQGITTAKNIVKLIHGNNDLTEFVYHNKGTVCSLGDHNAIGVAFGMKFKGYFASILKKVVDDRALFMIGGLPLMLKKGKFNIF